MRILFVCGREISYPRNQILLNILKYFGDVDVATPSIKTNSIFTRSIFAMVNSTYKLMTNRYDLIFIGFFGHLLTIPLFIISRTPILFDAFVSAYDTLISDRKIDKTNSLLASIAFWLDQKSCQVSSHVLLDSKAHIIYFSNTFQIPQAKFDPIPVSCDENIFFPLPVRPYDGLTRVLFYGTFLPLHGIDTILYSAKQLEGEPIIFRIIGDGMEYKNIRLLAEKIKIHNIEFLPPMPLTSLPNEISLSDICLGGHFGKSEKARMVIAGKTYQYIAMGKTTIVGDNPANRELLTHQYDSWFCPMNDPQGLADAIYKLSVSPIIRDTLGANARETYLRRASSIVLQSLMKDVITKLVD